MSSIIINILIIIIAVSPFIYIFLAGRGKKKMKSNFLAAARQNGLHPDKTEAWAHGAMGLDSSQNVFCYQSQLSGNSFHQVNLSEVKSIEVKKEYAPHSGQHPDLSFLKNVSLHLKTGDNKDINLPVFDSGFDKQVSSELMMANEWQNILSAKVDGKK